MKFYKSLIFTLMDILVFILCVDQGLAPVTIVGACYIALRLFGKDSQNMIATVDDAGMTAKNTLIKLVDKIRSMRPENMDG